ncbi:hypothetical protein PV08_05976 [Exophiala spinifera]|uniref:Uncharacterized protein n=1 Tax=Exophiala spinifera TaxID=91928 RepID=A0A0D1YLL5_9EURO|nr:uncharacterized protein PV08_05976 [Exophiala spinifera]KIW15926.1 hypothetical protein PV08_05976 [Exophiala spinifera]
MATLVVFGSSCLAVPVPEDVTTVEVPGPATQSVPGIPHPPLPTVLVHSTKSFGSFALSKTSTAASTPGPVGKRTWDDHPYGPPHGHHYFHHGPHHSPAGPEPVTAAPSPSSSPSWASTLPSRTSSGSAHGAKSTSNGNNNGNGNGNGNGNWNSGDDSGNKNGKGKGNGNGNGNGNGSPQGTAYVKNACPFTVMSNIVHGASAESHEAPEEIYSSIAPGQTLSHPFSHDPNTGVSWKIWRTDVSNQAPVQFEYTWIPDAKRTWWDLSMIDAGRVDWLESKNAGKAIVGDQDGYGAYVGRVGVKHAFVNEGMSLVPSAQQGICEAVVCRPGEQFCKTAYNVWNDWGQQRDCHESVDLTLTLCE